MVLDAVTEYDKDKNTKKQLDSILLNGGNIAMIVPGKGPEDN
jgi:small nuclear ribonucleoprotein (snRNP)-like protein